MVYYVRCKSPECGAIGVRSEKERLELSATNCRRCGAISAMRGIPLGDFDRLLHYHREVPVEERCQFNDSFLASREGAMWGAGARRGQTRIV